VRIEHDIVRAAQRMPAALRVHRLEPAGRGIDNLDAAADIVVALHDRPQRALVAEPGEAAVIAQEELALRSDRQAVRAAGDLGDDVDFTCRRYTRNLLPGDLDEQHRSIGHCHGSFRKLQTSCDDVHVRSVVRW
jgi:hypothetical protein